MHHDAHAVGFGGELGERLLLGRARVDHERLAGLARERDLRGERPLLVGARRALAVEVEARLADRHAALVRREPAQLGEVGVVEAPRGVRVAADRGVHLREVLGRRERRAARGAVDPDREDARARRPPRPRPRARRWAARRGRGGCGSRSRGGAYCSLGNSGSSGATRSSRPAPSSRPRQREVRRAERAEQPLGARGDVGPQQHGHASAGPRRACAARGRDPPRARRPSPAATAPAPRRSG